MRIKELVYAALFAALIAVMPGGRGVLARLVVPTAGVRSR